ncbi:tetratricopeptide repeat protein [Prevotella sp. AGR2160]|uniref:tetratricopeptide repeat protein n=1 Tax=Prevotella sp. AGR2160 TaxID=1280674 RepID=UPI000426516A|nr:tetratricopeptide repeat protein [Prevotella sp. AGR2160]
MKAIKYVVMAALLTGFSSSMMAQSIDQQIEPVAKTILANKNNPDAYKDAVKAFYKANKKNPKALVALGNVFLNASDTAQAKHYAEEAIKRDAHCGAGYILLGDIEALKDDGGEAAMWYQNAKTMDPQNPDGYIRYASVYRGRSPEEAFASLEELRKIRPDFPVDATGAHFFYKSNQFEKAATLYGRVAPEKLDKSQLHEYAGACYFSGQNDKSLEVATFGHNKYPKDAVFSRLMMYNQLVKKDYADAEKSADALFNGSDSAKYSARDYIMAGHVFYGAQNYDKAVEMFKKSLEYENNNDTHKLISDVYSAAGKVDDALNEYNTYINGKPNKSANDLISLAEIYTNAAEKDAAKRSDYYRKADKVYGDLAEQFPTQKGYALYYRGMLNSTLDPEMKTGAAKPYFEELIKTVKDNEAAGKTGVNDKAFLKQAYTYLGTYYFKKGNKAEGDAQWEALLEVDPENATAKAALGRK